MILLTFQLVLAIILFLLVNWLGRHAKPFGYHSLSLYDRVEEAHVFNFLYRLITPQVFLIFCTLGLGIIGRPDFAHSIWHVTAFYYLVRWSFNLLMGRGLLISWRTQIPLATMTIGLSYLLSKHVLHDPRLIIPNPQDMAMEIWLVVLLFLYKTVNGIQFSGSTQAKRQQQYLAERYSNHKGRYHEIISSVTNDPWIEALIYAILIFEDFNRPTIPRAIESYLLFPLGLARTLGPMQITTTSRIGDKESVRLGAERVSSLYPQAFADYKVDAAKYNSEDSQNVVRSLSRWELFSVGRRVAAKYNPDKEYANEVRTIYEMVVSKFYPDITPPDDGSL